MERPQVDEFTSVHDAFHSRLELVLNHGELSQPITSDKSIGSNFGQDPRRTYEIIADKFTVTGPRNRLMGDEGCRSMNMSFAVANFLWSIDENSTHDAIVAYNRHGEKFLSPDGKFQCAIPDRVVTDDEGNLIKEVIRILSEDSSSRRAIIPFIKASDVKDEPIDLPCPSYAHFFVRNERLDLVVGMRSQSLMGVFNYDVFLFTMLQEAVALEVGVELGRYVHISDSLHIYANERQRAELLLGCQSVPRAMASMAISPITNPVIHDAERSFRTTGEKPDTGDAYWNEMIGYLKIDER